MGSWLGKVFGTDEATRDVINVGKELLDDAFYTDAEKAAGAAADKSEVRGMLVNWMANTQGQNVSRRVISWAFTGTWLSMYGISTCLSTLAPWVSVDRAARILESSKVLDSRIGMMDGAVMLILGFYFALPKVSEIATSAIERFGKKTPQE